MVSMTLLAWRQAPQKILIAALRAYRLLLSPWLGSQCRFEPTCSAYAIQALERHGASSGSYLAARRVLRCHPWCDGGLDPVPEPHARLESNPTRRIAPTSSKIAP